jgi:hypothetical protein
MIFIYKIIIKEETNMKINKVLLIQQVEENKVRYIFELADMPRFVINCGSYYPVEAIHYAASIDIIDERVVGQCLFNVCDAAGHICDYKFSSEEVRVTAVDVLCRFINRMAPVFPVVGNNKPYTFDEYEDLVKTTVRFSYIPSPLMTFGVPFGVKYTGGTVTDIRCFSDNTLFTGLHGQRMLKSGDRLYMECGHLGSLSIPAIKSCWSCHEINNNPQSWTFIVSKTEQLQDYSGDNLKARIEDTLKSSGVNADEVCALLEKYSGYFDVCDDILKVFAKQPAEPAEKQIVNKEITLDVMQQTVLNAVYSMDSDKLKETYKNCGYYVAVLKVKVSFNEHVSMKIVLAVDNKKGSFYSYAVLLCDGEEILHSAIRDQFLGDWKITYDNVVYKAVVCGRDL